MIPAAATGIGNKSSWSIASLVCEKPVLPNEYIQNVHSQIMNDFGGMQYAIDSEK